MNKQAMTKNIFLFSTISLLYQKVGMLYFQKKYSKMDRQSNKKPTGIPTGLKVQMTS